VTYPISNEGFQVWLGDRKLASNPSSMAARSYLGMQHIYGSPHVMEDVSIGSYAQSHFNGYLSVDDGGFPSINYIQLL
jgi:hypothetical protein